MNVDDIWKNRATPIQGQKRLRQLKYKTLHREFNLIVATLDRVSDRLVEKGILHTRVFPLGTSGEVSGQVELPVIIQQHLKGNGVFMDDTPENQKILDWFFEKAERMLKLHDMIRSLAYKYESSKQNHWTNF